MAPCALEFGYSGYQSTWWVKISHQTFSNAWNQSSSILRLNFLNKMTISWKSPTSNEITNLENQSSPTTFHFETRYISLLWQQWSTSCIPKSLARFNPFRRKGTIGIVFLFIKTDFSSYLLMGLLTSIDHSEAELQKSELRVKRNLLPIFGEFCRELTMLKNCFRVFFQLFKYLYHKEGLCFGKKGITMCRLLCTNSCTIKNSPLRKHVVHTGKHLSELRF